MPPPCHSANTPGACGAADTSDGVNGTLLLVMDMAPPPVDRFYAGISGVDARGAYMSNHSHTRERRFAISDLRSQPKRHRGCRFTAMPLKPNGATCRVREQIIEDAASGL